MFKKIWLGFFAAALLVSGLANAANVSAINVELTDGGVAPEVLRTFVLYTIETKEGETFNPATLSKDVAALYKTGSFDDVKTSIVNGDDGNVLVVFKLASRKQVSNIVITGATLFPERKLLHKVTHGTDVLLDYAKINADRKALSDYYAEKGYYGTEISSQVMANPDGKTLTIEYIVKETSRSKLEGVAFVGVTAVEEGELKDAIMTKRQWWRYIFRMGNYYNSALGEVDRQKIVEVYKSYGYWDARVTEIEERYDEDKEWVTVVFHVDEGQPYTIGEISLVGSQKFTAEYLLGKTSMKSGDVLTSVGLEYDMEAMKAEYEHLGYIDLRMVENVDRDPATHVANVKYQVQEGLPCRIQEIMIVGNVRTQDRVIRRELTIHPDDLADNTKIEQSKNRVRNLGYFSSVEFYPQATESASLRDLRLEVTEKPTGSLALGAGYSTEDSVLGYLELTEKNFDIGKLLNLERPIGGGQHFRSYLGFGSKTHNFDISWSEPSLFDSDFELSTDLFWNTRYEDEYDERHVGAGVMLSWPVAFKIPFFPDHVEYWKMGVGLRAEQIRISSLEDEEKEYYRNLHDGQPHDYRYPKGEPYSLVEEKGSHFTNRLILQMTRDTRNSFMFPTSGTRITLDGEYVSKLLGSYADYMKFHAGFVSYTPVCYDLVLKLSMDAYSAKHFSGDPIGIFDRYFAGGYGTVRGFRRHDIGPHNQIKNAIGGESMLVGSIELIKPIKDFMFFRVFCDVGNVDKDSFSIGSDYCASVGVGVQFRAIPVRIDYGFPIKKSKYLDGRSGRLHFNIDYSF